MSFMNCESFVTSEPFITDAELVELEISRLAWEANWISFVSLFIQYNFEHGDIISPASIGNYKGKDLAGVKFAFAALEESERLEPAKGAGRWFNRIGG